MDPCPAEANEWLSHQIRTEREEIFIVSVDTVPPRTTHCKINRERLPCQGQGLQRSEPWVWALFRLVGSLLGTLIQISSICMHPAVTHTPDDSRAALSESDRSPSWASRDQLNSPQLFFSTSVNKQPGPQGTCPFLRSRTDSRLFCGSRRRLRDSR